MDLTHLDHAIQLANDALRTPSLDPDHHQAPDGVPRHIGLEHNGETHNIAPRLQLFDPRAHCGSG